MLETRCWMLDPRCSMLDARCAMLDPSAHPEKPQITQMDADTGCWILDI